MKLYDKIKLAVISVFIFTSLVVTATAWFAMPDNSVDTRVSKANVIQQYFHSGTGTSTDPFIITRPIHYYHLAELYQRNFNHFAEETEYYFQLGTDLNGDGSPEVFAYDDQGTATGGYSDTLNMSYFTGNLAMVPVGTSVHPFIGHFNGNSLTVSNLSVVCYEKINNVDYGTCDVGVFGYVTTDADIHDIYFDNLTISVSGAAIADYNTCADEDAHTSGGVTSVYVGYVVGHLLSYTNKGTLAGSTVTANASPLSNVYVNNVTVTTGDDGTAAHVTTNFGLIGYVDQTDGKQSISISKAVEDTTASQGEGEQGWGGSIDMKDLFSRICTLCSNATQNKYPTAQTVVGASSSNGYPSTTTTSTGTFGRSSIYYWSAMSKAGIGTAVNSTGGSFYGSRSGDWTYLYGVPSGQTTTTTTKTKTGTPVTAYQIYDNGAYLSYDGTAFSGGQILKSAAKWIPVNPTTTQSLTSAKYYMLINDTAYYLAANGTTGIKAVSTESAASVWYRTDRDEFYTVIGSEEYYLFYNGTWTLSANVTRYAVGDGEGHFLGASADGVHNELTQADGAVWQVTSTTGDTSFYFTSGGSTYYLTYDGELTVKAYASNPPVWHRSAGAGGTYNYYYTVNHVNYYLLYDEGWKAVLTDGCKISFGDNFLRITKDADGNFVIGTGPESEGTLFQVEGSNNATTIKAIINGTGYYVASNGTSLTVSTTSDAGWKVSNTGKLYRTLSFTQTVANGNYYLIYRNGWHLSKESGYQIVSDTHYLSLQDGTLVDTTQDLSTIWQISTSAATSSIYTTVGNQVYYLSFNPNSDPAADTTILYADSSNSYTWTKDGTSYYGTVNGDALYLCYQNKWTAQPKNAYYIHATGANASHYLTYRNTAAVDGAQSEAHAWVIKETSSGVWSIYTYREAKRFYLGLTDSVLSISSSSAATWGKDSKGFYLTGGYYLTFDTDNTWKVIKMTDAAKLHYDESATVSHYLNAIGGELGDVDNAGAASLWYIENGGGYITTYIGTTMYYLTYKVETVLIKNATAESSQIVGAYRRIVPCVSQTNNGSTVWAQDTSGRYYLTIQNVKFYLYYDTEEHEWALEEYEAYQIKDGSDYLTLKEYPVDLTAGTISFSAGALCRSSVENYQWHVAGGQLFTLLGDVAYYVTYTASNVKAQPVSITTEKPSGTLFTKDGNTLKSNISNVVFNLTYYEDGVELPSEYTRIEYLESKNNAYIDTGVTDAKNVTVDLDIYMPFKKSKYVYGSTQDSGTYIQNGLYSSISGNGQLWYAFNHTVASTTTSNRIVMTQTLVNSGSQMTVTLNGTSNTVSTATTSSLGNILIFATVRNKAFEYFGTGAKLYRFTIKSDNVIIRDFVPVMKSDGATGLFDLVEQKFYGEFYATNSIPAAYSVVEYVQSTGNVVIDTGVTDGKNITIDCDVEAPFSKGQYLFGSRQNSSSMMYNGLYSNPGQILLEFAYLNGPVSASNRVRMTQVLRGDNGETVDITINGTTVNKSTGSAAPSAHIFIFGCQKSSGEQRYIGSGMKVYSFTIKDRNNVVRDYVPVKRNSDGAYGLFELVTQTFYLVATGGNTATPEIEQSQLDTLHQNGYSLVYYIESTGNQIIDTGVADATDITVDCEVEAPFAKSKYLFGSQQDNGDYIQNGLYSSTNGRIQLFYGFGDGPLDTQTHIKMTQTLSADETQTTVTINSVASMTMASTSTSGYVPRGNIYIFGSKTSSGAMEYFGAGMKVYRFTIKKSGEIIRDLVPVIRNSDGRAGLYDLVNGGFYDNDNRETETNATGNTTFFVVPNSSYYSISYGNTYMTVTDDANMTIGTATKNAANLYEYQKFLVTESSSGIAITVKRGNTTYYLSTNDAGSNIAAQGTLSFKSTPLYWQREDTDKYYHTIGTTKFYLNYDAAKGWFAVPSLVQLPFRYILSNGQYLVVNSSKNGITSTTTYSDTNEYLRWFVSGSNQLYAEISNVKYYLTWSASSGFGVTTTAANGTAFTIGTNTVAVTDPDSALLLYIVYDSSGWNVVANGGQNLTGASKNINMTSTTSVTANTDQNTKWYFANSDKEMFSYYNGKKLYLSFNGTNVTLSNTVFTWEKDGSLYYTVYNSENYYISVSGSTVTAVKPTQFKIYIVDKSGTKLYAYRNSSYTAVKSTTNANYAGRFEITTDKRLTMVDYSSGSAENTYYIVYDQSSAGENSSGAEIKFQSTSPTGSNSGTSWVYSSSSFSKTNSQYSYLIDRSTYYVFYNVSSSKFVAFSTGNSSFYSDGYKTHLYQEFVTPSGATSLSHSSASNPTSNVLNSATYTSGMTPKALTMTHTTLSVFSFGSGITSVKTTVPVSYTITSRQPDWAQQTYTISGLAQIASFTVEGNITKTLVTVTPSPIVILVNEQNPTVSILTTTEIPYVTTTASYRRGTYIPLKIDTEASDYRAHYMNTGYIVGGPYSAASGSGRGDIRVSAYSIGNISGSYATKNGGNFSNIYTFNDSGTTPVQINPNANSYVEFAETKEKFLQILRLDSSDVYGLHFMDAQISTGHIMYAESVMINNHTYVNYELPESSIDFNVTEQGHVILYAGDYYTGGNSCFFSFNQVFRDASQHITAIKEIAEVYTKPGLSTREYYIYKYTDGTYSNANGTYTGATTLASGYSTTPLFKTKWLTNPTNGRDFSNDYIYYFEVPCNKGEYCLGSVEGQNGGYLLYLDIASNGTNGSTYNQTAGISGEPLFTEIGYLSEGTWLNSLLNIAYTVPQTNNGDSAFSVKVSYDTSVKIFDARYNTMCDVFDVYIENHTGASFDFYVLLVDDDDDTENDYTYRYRIYYNGSLYTMSDSYDPETGVFFATASFRFTGS